MVLAPGVLVHGLSIKPFVKTTLSPGSRVVTEYLQSSGLLTELEALANIREAIVGCLEVRAEEGLPLTVRVVDVDVAVA